MPFLVPLLSLVVVAVAISFAVLGRPGPWAPLHFSNPQTVDFAASNLHPGGVLVTHAHKCNSEHDDVVITASSDFRIPNTHSFISRFSETLSFEPAGCVDHTFQLMLPADMPPGIYIVEGFETAHRAGGSGDTQYEVWYSVPFTVVLP